ncbi:MAG: acyltransferase [Gemmataceae bacterium]|nr:acyltransferase [Gemmataceae bacterium]
MRFENVQALRGAACLAVVAYHAAEAEAGYGLGFNPLKPARWFGYAGVDLFFVLSGFIIAATARADLGRPARLPRFLFRRVWRIYPPYWAALAVAVGVSAAVVPAPVVRDGLAPELAEAALLLPRAENCRFLPVAWTLSYELAFYLAFAGLFLAPRRAAGPVLMLWAAGVFAAAVAGWHSGNRFTRLATEPFVLEFLAGCGLAWVPVTLGRRAAAGLVLLAVGWAAAGSAWFFRPDPTWLPVHHGPRVLVFGLAAALLVLAAAGRERAGGRVRRGWLTHAGDASYSIYLLHVPGLIVTLYLTTVVGWDHKKAAHLGWVAVMLAGGILPGLVFHRLVERPLLNLAKRKPRPAPAANHAPHLPARRAA